MILGIFKYDSPTLAGPIHTASSASLTWRLSLSASEYTATVFIPSSFAALIILTAISPLFAILHCLAGAVRGAGKTMPPMIILLFSMCI